MTPRAPLTLLCRFLAPFLLSSRRGRSFVRLSWPVNVNERVPSTRQKAAESPHNMRYIWSVHIVLNVRVTPTEKRCPVKGSWSLPLNTASWARPKLSRRCLLLVRFREKRSSDFSSTQSPSMTRPTNAPPAQLSAGMADGSSALLNRSVAVSQADNSTTSPSAL